MPRARAVVSKKEYTDVRSRQKLESTRTAKRENRGRASAKSSSRFPVTSGPTLKESPVILPPGDARLLTKPEPTGSLTLTITIGMVVVALLAAIMDKLLGPTTTSILRLAKFRASSC